MITTKTKLRFNSNNRKEILQTVYRLSELDLKSKGCLKAEVWKDVSDKNILYLVEEWSSYKYIEKHNLSKSKTVLCGLQYLLEEDLQTLLIGTSDSGHQVESLNICNYADCMCEKGPVNVR